MRRLERIAALVIALALVGASASLLASHFSEPPQVTIATYRQAGSLPVWVAKDLGLFDARGVEARIVEFSGGGLTAHVLTTGGADVAGMPAVRALELAEMGLQVRLVHATADLRPGTTQLLVRSDVRIETLENLEGLTIAFEALEDSCLPCLAFRHTFKTIGVSVHEVAVPDYKIEEAFAAQSIDAAVVSQPFNTLAVEKEVAYVLEDPRLGLEGDAAVEAFGVRQSDGTTAWMGSSGFWTRSDFLAAKSEAIHRVALAIADAATWLKDPANRPLAREILIRYAGGLGAMEFFQSASDAVLSTMEWRAYPDGYVDWNGLQRQADAYADLGLLDVRLDVRPLVSTPWYQA